MRPVAFVVYWAVFAQLIFMNEVSGLSNAEFYDLIKDYITDVEVLDNEFDYLQDESDDVINLPGGPDDEIDLDYIADKLGLTDDDDHYETDGTDTDDDLQDDNDEDLPDGPGDYQDVEYTDTDADVQGNIRTGDELDAEYLKNQRSLMSNDEVGFRRYRRHHFRRRHYRRRHRRRRRHRNRRHRNRRRRRSGIGCYCQNYRCSCCLRHTFRVNLIFKRLRFRLHACITVAYLRDNIGFEVSFVINSHRLFHREISLKHPPPLCFGIPGLKYFARVCLEFYNINLSTKRVCARIAGILDLWIKKFRVHLKLGCFRIPILDEQALTDLLNDGDFLSACVQEPGDSKEAVDLHDWLQFITSNNTSKETKSAMVFSRLP